MSENTDVIFVMWELFWCSSNEPFFCVFLCICISALYFTLT